MLEEQFLVKKHWSGAASNMSDIKPIQLNYRPFTQF